MAIQYDKTDCRSGESKLRQCQLVLLKMLHVIDEICRENGISYFLESGTLLGAMRHDGFIPWDDDLDIGMTEGNYKKFLKVAPRFLPDGLVLITPDHNRHVAVPIAKLRDANSFYFECRDDFYTTDASGVFVDIFCYEELPALPSAVQNAIVLLCGSLWHRSIWLYHKATDYPLAGILLAACGFMTRIAYMVVRGIVNALKIFPGKKYSTFKFEWGRRTFGWAAGRRIKTEWLQKLDKHKFEDGMFPVPSQTDSLLRTLFGDWKQLPPLEKRQYHAKMFDPFQAAT